MATVNLALGAVVDTVQRLLAWAPPLVGVALWSLLVAVAMLLVYKRTSNQARLEEVKRQIHACLFELRLFSDDLSAVLRAQAEILRHNLVYLRLSLVPIAWLMVPLVLLVAQLQFRYGYTGLAPGQSTVVAATLAKDRVPAGGVRPDVRLEAPEGVRIESPAVWAPALGEVSWRVTGERPGRYRLRLRLGGDTVTKSLVVADGPVRRSPRRPSSRLLDELLWPAEAPLPAAAPFTAVRLVYPEAGFGPFGWRLHWLVWFVALSMLFALVLRRPFGVVI